jgi:peptide/nickel transport system permease protein
MITYILRRVIVGVLVLIAVSGLAFWLTNISVDPAVIMAGEGASDGEIARIRVAYGFDAPLYQQYLTWLGRWAVGDFGISYRWRQSVATVLLDRLPATAVLSFGALALVIVTAIPLGVLAAVRPNSRFDKIASFLAASGTSMPSFWVGLLLIILFGVQLRWLPISGSDTALHFVLPILALAFHAFPPFMRLVRVGMLEALNADYIRTARAKGLSRMRVLYVHALRNAILPIVALAAAQLGHLLAGSVVIESVFAIRGLGLLAWEAVNLGDLPVFQAVLILGTFFYVVLTFLADVLSGVLDPRARVN